MEWVPSPLATVAAWVLTATFLWAAVAKFVRGNAWPAAIARFGFAGAAARAIAVAVPVAELVVAILLGAGAVRAGAALTLSLVASFSAAIVSVRMLRKTDKVPCGCFGGAGESDYRVLLARNGALAVLAAIILFSPRAASPTPPSARDLVPSTLVILGGALVVWMVAQTLTSLRRR